MAPTFDSARMYGLSFDEQLALLRSLFVRRSGYGEHGVQYPSLHDHLRKNLHAFSGPTHEQVVQQAQSHIAPDFVSFSHNMSGVGKGLSKNQPVLGIFEFASLSQLDEDLYQHIAGQSVLNYFAPLVLVTAEAPDGTVYLVSANQSMITSNIAAWDECHAALQAHHTKARAAAEHMGFSNFKTWAGVIVHGFKAKIAALMNELGMDDSKASGSLTNLHGTLSALVVKSPRARVEWSIHPGNGDPWGYGKMMINTIGILTGVDAPQDAAVAQLTKKLLRNQ